MTKKDKILKLFNSMEWFNSPSGEKVKTITYDDFRSIDLNPTIEYCESYCDIIYARRVIQKLGHKVLIGTGFHVYKAKQKEE